MAQRWQAFPSGISTASPTPRSHVDPVRSIGTPYDAAASDVTEENSAFSLLKGIARRVLIPVGSGNADVNDNAKVHGDPLATLGAPDDAPAVDAGSNSAIALMKGILVRAGFS